MKTRINADVTFTWLIVMSERDFGYSWR